MTTTSKRARFVLSAAAAVVALTAATPARAEIDTFHQRSTAYWLAHGGGMVTGLALTVASSRLLSYSHSSVDVSFLDAGQRGTQGNTASGLSSGLFLLGLVDPLPAWATEANAPRFFHATFIYGEALIASNMLSTWVSHIRRPRPRTYDPDRVDDVPQCSHMPESECDSFYSARASAAFTSAWTSSYLFSELYRRRVPGANATPAAAWAVQLGLAAMTSGLQVKAGEAFVTDALLGAAAGTAIGGGLYWAHSGSLHMKTTDALGAGLGLVVGTAIAWAVPTGKSSYGSFIHVTNLDVPGVGLAIAGDL